MPAHKGIEYQWVGNTGTIYHHGEMYPIEKREGLTKSECAMQAINALLADKTHSIRPKSRGALHTEVADLIMNNLRARGVFMKKVEKDNDLLDEIHEEIRSELASHYGPKL